MNAPLHREMPAAALDAARALAHASEQWDGDIVRQLTDYIAIPAKSPELRPRLGSAHGYIETVVRNAAAWVEAQKVPGLKLEIVRLPTAARRCCSSRCAATTRAAPTQTVLMYGHLDKQPEFNGWRNDLGPWTPKYEDGKLYGRGGADDGYAVYASIAAMQALKAQGSAAPALVGLIETCEESRLLRPAALRGRAAPAPGRRRPGGLPGLRRRQLRPAVADHPPARHGQRHAEGARS